MARPRTTQGNKMKMYKASIYSNNELKTPGGKSVVQSSAKNVHNRTGYKSGTSIKSGSPKKV